MPPDRLPSISEVRRITKSLAMLDAILSPDWAFRYYSFNCAWALGQEMASLRNGSGDDWFLWLGPAGAALKGFVDECVKDTSFAKNIQTHVPAEFSSFLNEPAFSMQHATFCYWRKADDASWSKVSSMLHDDGSSYLLALLIAGPSGYKAWAEDYFEVPVALDAVTAVFSHEPLTDSLILSLNPDADLEVAYGEAQEIGYPQ